MLQTREPLAEIQLSQLSNLVLAGTCPSVFAILQQLRLSARELNMTFACILPRWSEQSLAGDTLLAAVGKARLPSVQAWSDGNESFSPNTLEMRLFEPPPPASPTIRVVTEYWKNPSSKDQLLSRTCTDIQMFDGTGYIANHRNWLPMFRPLRVREYLLQRTGWSLADLSVMKFASLQGTSPSQAFWPYLSMLPKLQQLTIAPCQVSSLVALLCPRIGGVDDDDGSDDEELNFLPFPRLRHIEIIVSSHCPDLEDILKPLVDTLEMRRELALRCGEGSGGALDSLSIMGRGVYAYTSFLDDIPPTLVKHVFRDSQAM